MPSNKKYYWLKLHEEFFNQTVMKYIRKLPEMVGSETVAAARMRNLREKRAIGAEEMAALLDKGNNVTSCSPDVTGCYSNVPKRYLEIEKELEKDKETEQDRESETEETGPKIYGVNQNVIFSDSKYESCEKERLSAIFVTVL